MRHRQYRVRLLGQLETYWSDWFGGLDVSIEGQGKTVVTGDDGSFSITDVPVGDYTISASKDGVGSITSEITVRADTTTRFDLAFSSAP